MERHVINPPTKWTVYGLFIDVYSLYHSKLLITQITRGYTPKLLPSSSWVLLTGKQTFFCNKKEPYILLACEHDSSLTN